MSDFRAVKLIEPKLTRVVDYDRPDHDGKALVRVETVGVCGTDTSIVAGKIPAPYPLVIGHEAVGVVEAPGPTGAFSVGDRVLVDPGVACGVCSLCRRGYQNICRSGGLLGRDFDGVFADYAAIAEAQLLTVPPEVSADGAGLLQVLGTCVHAVSKATVMPGDVVVVLGLGVGGQLISQLLRLRGATVIGVARSKWKRELAVRLGAHVAVDHDQAEDAVAEASNGEGAALVVEAVGVEATFAQAIRLAGSAGSVVLFGTATSGTEGLPYYDLYFKELTIFNPRAANTADYKRAIDLVAAGDVKAEPLITNRFSIDDADAAFEAVGDSASLKVLMTT